MNASSLISQSSGTESCFYCGNKCSEPYDPPSAFTGWSDIACPHSRFICGGCLWSLDQKREIAGRDKLQKTQIYSWLIEEGKQTPYLKSHKSEIREHLLSPPAAPWAFAIAESGQKHLVYRTPVNLELPYIVRLEMELVAYRPEDLKARIDLAKRVIAAVGHKGAAKPSVVLAIVAGGELAEEWFEVCSEPLTRLALYVCPSKEICENDIKGT